MVCKREKNPNIFISSGSASLSTQCLGIEILQMTHKHTNIVFGKAGVMRWCWLFSENPLRIRRVDSGCFTASVLASDWPDFCFQKCAQHTRVIAYAYTQTHKCIESSLYTGGLLPLAKFTKYGVKMFYH